MGQHPSATLYYGFRFKRFDGTPENDWEDEVGLEAPWRLGFGAISAAGYAVDEELTDKERNDEFDSDDAIAIASGVTGRVDWANEKKNPAQHAAWSGWRARVREANKTCPVEFVLAGYDGDGEYHLALKSSIQHAHDYEVEAVNLGAFESWCLHNIGEARKTLIEWADKLGIPREIRGEIGWHMFATYG